MEIAYTLQAYKDLQFWKNENNTFVLKKIRSLVESMMITPYSGLGKPEPLKHSLSGCWSRRINKEHRLIYEVKDELIVVLSLKGHY